MEQYNSEIVVIEGQALRVFTHFNENATTPPLLVFNGIGANFELLLPFVDALGERSVVCFDIPGIGGSPISCLPYRVSGLVGLAAGLLDHYSIDKVDVMGYSWGGGLAQEFAYRHPDYCRRLILAATSPGVVMVPGSPKVLLKMINPSRYASPGKMFKQSTTLYGGVLREKPELLNEHASRMMKPSLRGYWGQIYALMGWTSIHWLHKLKMPTLILAGNDDPIVPLVNAKILAARIPNSRIKVLDCGHMFIITQIDPAARLISKFLDQA